MFYGTPNMAQALHEHPDRGKRDLSSLRGGATIGTPEQIMRVVELGAREICNIYGLTETYGNCNVADARDPLEKRLSNVGRPLPGVEQRIVDPETGRILPAGEVGEIRVKGYVTTGYYKDPSDARGLRRARLLPHRRPRLLDADGYLHFRGRIKDMVKTGGINVAPIEVEEALLTPGRSGRLRHRRPRCEARRAPRRRHRPQARRLAQRARRHRALPQSLAAYKIPRLIRFAAEEELPLTTTGKVQKNRLANTFAA